MAEEEKELEYEVEDDKGSEEEEKENQEPEDKKEEEEEKAQDQEATEEDLEKYGKDVQKRIDRLTYRLREAERREEAALEYAQSAKKHIENREKELKAQQTMHVQEFGDRIDAQKNALRTALRAAIENGDVDKQVELQETLSKLAHDEVTYAQRKVEAEKEVDINLEEEKPKERSQQADPRAIRWAQENQWFGKDEVATAGALAIHRQLTAVEGYDTNTDEYYEELNTRIREEFPHKFKQEGRRGPETNVAPGGRNSRKNAQKRSKKIKLTPSQVAIAKSLGVSLEDYAKQVALLDEREGA